MLAINYVAFRTLVRKEVTRLFRIWSQTFVPPVITMTLYLLIFGHLMGPRIADMNGFPYIQFIAPGLIMMAVINNAYMNVVSSFFSTKFMKNIEELLIAPISNHTIILGYCIGGIIRGLVVGVLIAGVTLLFTHLHIRHFLTILVSIVCAAAIFSLAGFINAIFARTFDSMSIIPTFILTPLTYLGGIFYSVRILPPFWQTVSHYNPMLYLINTFRYGVLGVSDVDIHFSLIIMLASILVLYSFCYLLMQRGVGIKE